MSASKTVSKGSVNSTTIVTDDVDESSKPEFIYGGPFIKVEKPSPIIDTATPFNLELQGTFKKSFAYYSLKERLPVILTKIIDYLSREGSKIKSTHGASDEDILSYIQYVTKLKNDLVTNKQYDLLTVDTPEARRWNQWIEALDIKHYFTNVWVFTECYVYRRLREGCELSKTLKNFDPFADQKQKSFEGSLELMCIVADKLVNMLSKSDKDKCKSDFVTLLKLCLWANKCDLSLSSGEQVFLNGNNADGKATTSNIIDPFQMILDFKDKLLVDDTSKIVDQVTNKAEAMMKNLEAPASAADGAKGSPPETPAAEAADVPCPTKMTSPQHVMFDIVCDNAGYELFADLCLAHFLISQGIVQKIRFHVKNIPWFVSDVTPVDFKWVIDSCLKASYRREVPQQPTDAAEGEVPPEPEPPRVISADNLRALAEQWTKYVDEGTFVVLHDDFWTSPHVYRDMKRHAPSLYRQLQYAVALLFKGDLNYRKLLCEKNVPPTSGLEAALQGFLPAPVIAVRTVKADLICGLPKGKWDQLNALDDKWMQKGDFGVIQYCGKVEPLKVADRPCDQYGDVCRGAGCGPRTDM